MKYTHVVVAGTFDRLHRGHEAILTKAFKVGERVTIGLTSDVFIRTFKYPKYPKHPNHPKLPKSFSSSLQYPVSSIQYLSIHPYRVRYNMLSRWLRKHHFDQRTNIVPIDDPYGPLTKDDGGDVQALVVSTDTRSTADRLNNIRTQKGLRPLAIVEIPMVPAQDLLPINSTRVRNGDIDRTGRLVLPDALRPELKKPLGIVYSNGQLDDCISHAKKATQVITVGDQATLEFLKRGCIPDLMIIDHQVRRKPFDAHKELLQKVHAKRKRVISGPGYISKQAVSAITDWAKHPVQTILEVDGEEDLLVLPVIVHAPAGSYVYYGQPEKGLVEVRLTKGKKASIVKLLKRFERPAKI